MLRGGTAAPEIAYDDGVCKQAYLRNVHLVVWRDAPSAMQMREYGRCAQALHQRYPSGSALVNLIVSGTPNFASEVRDLARQYTREGLHSIGTAHVVIVTGLLGSAVRGFLGTTVLLGRPPNPTKVFADVEESVRWLAERFAAAEGARPELPPREWIRELTEVCHQLLDSPDD